MEFTFFCDNIYKDKRCSGQVQNEYHNGYLLVSDKLLQKILTEKANPSLDKIDLISEYFDVESWEMLYNFRKDNDDMLHILQMLQKLPASSMPVVKEFLTFLLKQFPDSSEH